MKKWGFEKFERVPMLAAAALLAWGGSGVGAWERADFLPRSIYLSHGEDRRIGVRFKVLLNTIWREPRKPCRTNARFTVHHEEEAETAFFRRRSEDFIFEPFLQVFDPPIGLNQENRLRTLGDRLFAAMKWLRSRRDDFRWAACRIRTVTRTRSRCAR